MPRTATTAETMTTGQVLELRLDAGEAGDQDTIAACDAALCGDADAMATCARIISALELFEFELDE